ncbi:MAG: LTA synthase family protein [Bacilli bacterium]
MKKEVKKAKNNQAITKIKNSKIIINIKKFIKKYYYIITLSIPFILMDIITRIFGIKINFFGLFNIVPSLFTFIWIFLMIGISIFLDNKKGKITYIIFFIISFILFLLNNIYYSMTNTFFDFSLLLLAGEGSSYILDAILNCNILVYILSIIIILTFIVALKYFPKRNKTNLKKIIKVFFAFLIIHTLIPLLLGSPDKELTWSTWRNPRNIYINFNDNNKSMTVAGLYEYSLRNFYITFIKAKKSSNEEDLKFLNETYNIEEENYYNKYTSLFKDKNLLIIQLEGIDDWLLNKEDTPNLYQMMNEGINFTNHYSYYNGGGSTFNSEFAVNTGFITPLSYTQNAYTFNKNSFPYSMANLFKNAGYTVNAFHMNTSEYYSRGTNYKNWGYDNYYGLKDLDTYKDDSYTLDRELILNETFAEKMFSSEKFLNYIITYSSHLPFSTEKGVCKKLVEEDYLKENNVEELPEDYSIPVLTEEECARRQVKETDYMISLLKQKLEEKDLLDDTVIVVFTDHYLYTLSDQSVLSKYKETNNNLINHTPFFIWSKDIESKKITEVTSQLNILPTLVNLFGLEYHPNYYIGEDALNPSYNGFVFFNDYSWYDGNVYVDGGTVTNGKYIDSVSLEDKNYYINYLIRKNDLTLKYDYFRQINLNKDKGI